jgi:hypothetical protein
MINLAQYYADLGRHPGWTDYVKGRVEEIEREEPGFREAVRRIVVAENISAGKHLDTPSKS